MNAVEHRSSFASRFGQVLVALYAKANKAGLLRPPIIERLFISAYVVYKRMIEDPFHNLGRRHPSLFTAGHIIDVGANIGYTSKVFAGLIPEKSQFKVFAFEPEAGNARRFRSLIAEASLSDRVECIEMAVGEGIGSIELWTNEGHHADHRIATEAFRTSGVATDGMVTVPMISIDRFLESRGFGSPIGFAKIDVQGYELPVLKGMVHTLNNNPRMPIAFEFAPRELSELGYDPADVVDFLAVRHFRFCKIHHYGSLSTISPRDLKRFGKARTESYLNILALPAGADSPPGSTGDPTSGQRATHKVQPWT